MMEFDEAPAIEENHLNLAFQDTDGSSLNLNLRFDRLTAIRQVVADLRSHVHSFGLRVLRGAIAFNLLRQVQFGEWEE